MCGGNATIKDYKVVDPAVSIGCGVRVGRERLRHDDLICIFISSSFSSHCTVGLVTAIAVTITTPNTPPRAATATDDDDPLLSHAGTVLTNDKNPVRPIHS